MASECWLWAGFKAPNGYGQVYAPGYGRSPQRAHRVIYEALVGLIPQGLVLDHLCRVRCCVNPEHLEPVTLKANILRGEGLSAKNANKTHCPQGHAYAETQQILAQSYKRKSVWRRCGKCHAIKEAERRRRIEPSQVK